MNSPAHSELAYHLTKHCFGETVALSLKTIFNYDQASLKLIKQTSDNLKLADLKRALLILVKYQLVDYIKTVKNFNLQFEYSVSPDRIFSFFRISRFIHSNNLNESGFFNYPDLVKTLVSLLAENAMLSREKLLNFAQTQPNGSGISQVCVADTLDQLINHKYIVESKNNFCLNYEVLERQHRNEVIVQTILRFYNYQKTIKSISQALLDLSADNTDENAALTAPVPISNLKAYLVPKYIATSDMLELLINELTLDKEFRFFISSGTHELKGPMYALNIGAIFDHLAKEHLCSVITARFGPKCCRVFKVLLKKGPLLLRQIEEIIMLPVRDVREYSYMLIKEGFIRNRQVPKTPDNAPGKSVFIMSVEIDHLMYNMTDLCCNSMSNLLMRYEFELKRGESLINRAKDVSNALKSDNINSEGWDSYFNNHELFELNKIYRILDRLLSARIEVDETLYILHSWLKIRPNLETQVSR